MQTNSPATTASSSEILERRSVNSSATTVQQMREIVGEAVDEHRACGQAEAIHRVGRDLGISARRVAGILRGEVARIWADELDDAKRWYVGHCARKAERLAHEAILFRARADALRERLG